MMCQSSRSEGYLETVMTHEVTPPSFQCRNLVKLRPGQGGKCCVPFDDPGPLDEACTEE